MRISMQLDKLRWPPLPALFLATVTLAAHTVLPAQQSQQSAGGGTTTPTAQTDRAPVQQPNASSESAQLEVRALLERWRQAIVANDAAAEASLYAPVLPLYYGRSQVSNADVFADKAAFINRGYRITEFTLDNMAFESLPPYSMRVQLVKNVSWLSPSGALVHKLIVSHLDLQHYDTGWKISGETDDR